MRAKSGPSNEHLLFGYNVVAWAFALNASTPGAMYDK